MGHTPQPKAPVSREQAIEAWNRKEAEREIDALFAGRPYTYQPPPLQHYVEGVGFLIPPRGGSSVQKRKEPPPPPPANTVAPDSGDRR